MHYSIFQRFLTSLTLSVTLSPKLVALKQTLKQKKKAKHFFIKQLGFSTVNSFKSWINTHLVFQQVIE